MITDTDDKRITDVEEAHGEALLDDVYRDWPGEPGLDPAGNLPPLPRPLHPCPSRQCDRRVGSQGMYCCSNCRVAWESTPRYEPHSHSEGCDRRHAERQGQP